jgi:polyisoprenoid-binding protein YceI
MVKKLGIVIGLVLAVVGAGFGYVWFSGGSGEPSSEVTAPPVTSRATTLPEPEVEEGQGAQEQQEAPPETVPEDPTTTTPTTTATSASTTSGTTVGEDPGEQPTAVVYRIEAAESSVSFEIDEILSGSPKRVVGTTNEVAGEVLIDFGDPATSRLGTVVINVRTLETDSNFRDRAMRGPILGSARDENEFATFEPTAIEGLPDRVAVGDRVALSVSGDFTLSGVTRPVNFEIGVTVVTADRIDVDGSATVLRSDFGLVIPDVPSVSDVGDEVLLVIDLVAVATDG